MIPGLDVVFEDPWLLVVDKPPGLLMHPSWLDRHETDTLASRVKTYLLAKNELAKVHTVHRLDRPTSGLVIIAKTDTAARHLAEQFRAQAVKKVYWAICRGFVPEQISVDYALTEQLDKIGDKFASKVPEPQSAQTDFRRQGCAELALPVSRYAQSRYSWVICSPHTGRKHQIRRHLKHIRHPILGDTKHGCRHHNKVALAQLGVTSLALRAVSIGFQHPVTDSWLEVEAPVTALWRQWLVQFGWNT
jgi:tRNA pseudouridine65 synthase